MNRSSIVVFGSFCVLLPAAAAARSAVDLAALERLVSASPQTLAIRLADVREAESGRLLALELDEFRVAAPGARLVLHGAGGRATESTLPAARYLRGAVAGEPGSRAVLALGGGVPARGLLFRPEGVSRLFADGRGGLVATAVADSGPGRATSAFRCAVEDRALPPEPWTGETSGPAGRPDGGPAYAARVALETDHEYYLRFGDAALAATYALDLIGYLSTIYAAETGTDLIVPYLSLWTTPEDPWVATSSSAALQEFLTYWNANRGDVERTIAHQLSSRETGGGIAYVGVLCNSGNAYGYTGTIDGNFDPQNPQTVWDSMAVAHEIGHNFSSPHTHCYNGYQGADPIDGCYNVTAGCYAGTLGIPGIGTVIGGNTADHPATIMSYCHLRAGGYQNITLTFGLDHIYGVDAERAPNRMAAHVASRAASNPACLAPVASDLIFVDGVESGGPWRWSGWEI